MIESEINQWYDKKEQERKIKKKMLLEGIVLIEISPNILGSSSVGTESTQINQLQTKKIPKTS